MAESLTLGVVIGATLGAAWNSTINKSADDLDLLTLASNKTAQSLKDIQNVQRLPVDIHLNTNKLGDAQKKFQKLQADYQQALRSGDANADKLLQTMERQRRRTEGISNALNKQKNQYDQSNEALKKAGVNTHQLANETERLKNKLREQREEEARATEKTKERSRALSELKTQALKIGATIGLLKGAASSAIEFESVMADVRKVVDFDTPDQFYEMGGAIRNMSQWIGLSAEGIGQIVAAGGQSGIARNELLQFAESAAKMGIAFDISAEQAGDTMAKWRSGLNLTQDEVEVLADQVNFLGNSGAATAAEIAGVISSIGALGDVSGLNGAAIAALSSNIIGAGTAPSVAATGIQNLMQALTKGEAATSRQQAAFDALGLSATDMAKRMQTDAQGAILSMLTAVKGLSRERQASVLTQLVGEAGVKAIAPLLNNLDALESSFKRVNDASEYGGSMQQEFDSRMDTTKNTLISFRNTLKNTAMIIGNVFLPPINFVVGGITALFRGINAVADKFPFLTSLVIAAGTSYAFAGIAVKAFNVAMAFAPQNIVGLLSFLGRASVGLNATGAGFLLAGKQAAIGGMMMVSSMSGASLAIAATGIGALVIGIALGAALIYKHWEPIKAFFTGMFMGISDALAPLKEAFDSAFAPVAPLFDAISSAVGGAIGWFKALFEPVDASTESLQNAMSAGQAFGQVIGSVFKALLAPIELTLTGISKVSSLVGAVAGWLGFGGSNDAEEPPSTNAEVITDEAVNKIVEKSSPSVTQTNQFAVEIHASPGMNEEQLAQKIADAIAEQQRSIARRERSGLYDLG